MQVSYSSIRPTIFGSFDIRKLKLTKDETVYLSVSRIRVSFSVRDLLSGKKTALRNVTIEQPEINLDWERDREIITRLSSLFADRDKSKNFDITEFYTGQTGFHIRDCALSVKTMTSAGYSITCHVQKMNFDIKGGNEDIHLSGRLDGEFIYADLLNRILSVKTSAWIKGEYSAFSQNGSAEISLTSLSGFQQETRKRQSSFLQPFITSSLIKQTDSVTTLFQAKDFFFGLVYSGGVLSLRTLDENILFSSSFEYNANNGGIKAELNCLGYPLTDIFRFTNNLKDLNYLLSQPVKGSAGFYYENSRNLRYFADFKGERDDSSALFSVHANGDADSISINELYLSSPRGAMPDLFQGEIRLSGRAGFYPFSPSGNISLRNFSLTGSDFFNAAFVLTSRGNEIGVSGKNITCADSVFDTEIKIINTDSDFSFTVSSLFENKGEVSAEAVLNYGTKQLDAFFAIDNFRVSDLAGIAGPFVRTPDIPEIASVIMKNTAVTTDIFLMTDFKKIVYNAPQIAISSEDVTGIFSLSGVNRQISLNEGRIKNKGNEFLVSSQLDFSNLMDLNFLFDMNYRDLSWHLEGQVLDKSTIILRDPNGLHAYGSISDAGAISCYLEGINFPVPVKESLYYLNFYLTLRYNSSDSWSLDIPHFRARDSNGRPANIQYGGDILRISGAADQNGAFFKELLLADNIGTISGNADFTWNGDFSSLQFKANMADKNASGESYNLEGMLKEKHLEISASVSNMRMDRFAKTGEEIVINGIASLAWDSINSFNALFKIKSADTRFQGNPVKASGDIMLTHNALNVNNFSLKFAQVSAIVHMLQLSLEESRVKANMDISGIVLQDRDIESKIELEAGFKKTGSWLEFKNAADSINGYLKADSIRYANLKHDSFILNISRENRALSVFGGPKNMVRLEMDNEGNFFASLSSPMPIKSTISGKFSGGILDAHCPDFFMDLSALWAILPGVPGFSITGGYITGKADIRGPVTNPQFFGSARASSIRLRVPGFITQDIRPVPVNLTLEGYEMTFHPVSATAGSGGGTASGWFRFENWVPRNVGLEITVPRETPIPYSLGIKGFKANGDASGKFNLILDNRTLSLSGDLMANNSELGINHDELKSRGDPGSARIPMIANFKISTGARVDFFWPNKNSPILRASPEMGTVLTVFADTLTGQYSLNSDITIRSGELYYFDRSFYIRQGSLVLRESEQKFEPRLNARAEIRDRTDSGPVTISMIVENESLFNFVPRFEANPILTQLEIYSLLGQNLGGITGSEDADAAQRFILSSATDILAQLVMNSEFFNQFISVRQIERQIRNFLGLDMFSVRTKILQNAVSNVNITGSDPVDRNSRVGNYFDNTTVSIGKYIGQYMFIQGMLWVRNDERITDYGGLRLEPEVSIEMQNPLFNIRWSFFPGAQGNSNPENWGVKDNSITLLWSRSF